MESHSTTHENGSLERDSVKVSFYLDIDEMAEIAVKIGQRYKMPRIANIGFYAFFLINLIVAPILLLTYGAGWIAFVLFILNFLFGGVFLQKAIKVDTQRFFRQLYGDLENVLAEVELTDKGVWCRTEYDLSFFKWETILAVEESPKAIHLMFRDKGLPVMKSGFAYRDQEREFVVFAEEKIRSFRALRDQN